MAGLILITIISLTGALLSFCKMQRMKRDVQDFADRLESSLDRLLLGKPMEEILEMEDSLWGKISEKLHTTAHIWEKREQKILEEKQEIKKLISDISHQTKTPIASLGLYLELLEQEPLTVKGQDLLSHLKKQTGQLDFLFQNMVKMSRLETGILQIRKQNTDLVQTLSEAMALVVPQASKNKLHLSADCGSQFFLPHDKKWTKEAVFNLLDNAVKYTSPGGSVTLTLTRQEIFTKISVIDTGKGIALERQAQIFTRFYREPEVHDQDGLGIGLYLARKIIELQNGYIEVHSLKGSGSDFSIYLPNETETVTEP